MATWRSSGELEVNMLEWDDLRRCQRECRLDCHAAFTATSDGEIWPFASFGNTPPDWRFSVRGWIQPLDKIADALLLARGGPGRFFISKEGSAYWRTEERGPEFHFLDIRINKVVFVPAKPKA